MTITANSRPSDSPLVASITRGTTLVPDAPIRPAEVNWHLVFSKRQGVVEPILVGPWSTSGTVQYEADVDILWIAFKPGVYMPRLPTKDFTDSETVLRQGAGRTFWLGDSVWQLPDYENADTFVEHLLREEVLAFDPLIGEALGGRVPDAAPRTVRYHFSQVAGLSQSRIEQVRRAHRAQTLLQSGTSILDTVQALGYYDQPHLTRALKQYIGFTPAQLQPTHAAVSAT